MEDFESVANVLADAAVASGDVNRLRAWWIFRMFASPDPLAERLTLMWHDHFATAQSKVEDLAVMRRQNETFRRLARAPFGELLNASVREPALLLYLDAPSNRKDHPNENLARELMELFTFGIGNFTEADVKEAARALTGWTVDDGAFREVIVEKRRRRENDLRPQGSLGGLRPAFDPARPAGDRPADRSAGSAACSWAKGPSTSRRLWPWPTT